MINAFIFIWVIVLLLAISAVAALVWAVSSGQLGGFQQISESIFDDEEPIGQPTDSFPEVRSL